ncbi:glycosyltransferase family 2 protein [Pseudomonadales bacterium]|nr:glycosyltransferase family 2 protein [Pseudomonadales bacterium]
MINVSIVTYHTPVNDLLNAVSTCALSPLVCNIYVIDNSPVNTLENHIRDIAKVSFLHNPSNPGYGAAHNIAIRHTLNERIPFHLVLNADVIFDFHILKGMLDSFRANKMIGLVAPKMLFEDGTVQCSRKLLPTPANMFLRAFLPKKFRSRIDSKFQIESIESDRSIFVPYVSGAFMLFKASTLGKIGIFDETFFMYPEDIDLSRRVAESHRVQFIPEFVITHKYGGATRTSLKMFVIHAYNMCLYFNKWGWIFDKNRYELNRDTLTQDDSRYLRNGDSYDR